MADGATSYAEAVLDGNTHQHVHPAEVGKGSGENDNHEQETATSYSQAVKEGMDEGHIHPADPVERDSQTEQQNQGHPSYAQVAAEQ